MPLNTKFTVVYSEIAVVYSEKYLSPGGVLCITVAAKLWEKKLLFIQL